MVLHSHAASSWGGNNLQDVVSEAGSLLESGSKSREVMRLRCRQWQEVMGMGYMCVVAEGLRGEPGSWLTRRAAWCLIPGVRVCVGELIGPPARLTHAGIRASYY